LLARHLNPGIAIGSSYHFVWQVFDVLLHGGVIEATTNETLRCEDGVLRVGDGLTLGWCADQSLSILCESHNGRSGADTFGVFEDLGGGALHDGDARVGGAQVDADDDIALGVSGLVHTYEKGVERRGNKARLCAMRLNIMLIL
jgi:hypothetical protein